MFNSKIFENSLPDGIPVLEVVGGIEEKMPPVQFVVPLKRSELRGEVMGPLAALRLIQTFGYAKNECDKVLEAVYRFPLPGDAAVSQVQVRFGDVEILADLKERQKAEAEYEQAKQAGRQAALATRESPDVFTLHVAGIQPDEEIQIETAYVQLARAEGNGWTLRIPLTTAPRYVRRDELNSRHAQGQPLALLRDPGHRFALDVVLHQGGEISSPTHALNVERKNDRLRVQLRDGEVLPDRDCVLRWQAEDAERHPTLHVMLHNDPNDEHVYFLALVAPPATHDYGHGVPREVILLVDHSGSMSGAKWEAADWTVERFLADLYAHDAFALGLFHNHTKWFQQNLVRATSSHIDQAVHFLKNNRDSGGTNLGVALEQALSLSRTPNTPARHLLVVTDAQVSDAGRVLRLANEEAERAERRRISVICIDAAPNDFLATELATRGGGVARFLTSSPKEGDITTALGEVLADWAEPVLAGLQLEINRPFAETTERAADNQPKSSTIDLGDLPAGRAVWVGGRFPRRPADDPLTFQLSAHGGQRVTSLTLETTTAGRHHALKALFGARRVAGLEFLINAGYGGERLNEQLERLGYDPQMLTTPAKSSKVYAENVRADAQTGLRELLVQEALTYGLASSETAFVAVRKEAGQPIEATIVVANALPSGWSTDFLMAGSPTMTRSGGMARSHYAFAAQSMMPAMAPPPPSPSGALYKKRARPKRKRKPKPQPKQERSMLGQLWDRVTGAEATAPPAPASAMSDNLLSPSSPSSSARSMPDLEEKARGITLPKQTLFSGVPSFGPTGTTQSLLFDSSQQPHNLPTNATLSGLRLHFPDGAPNARQVDRDLVLLLFVGDLSQPRAQVRLSDIVRMRGYRPLNLTKQTGDIVRLVLSDPNGAWAQKAPKLEIRLEW